MLTAEIVRELYQKMSKSVEARTMPPNAWLWSLISNSANQEDIKLLFQMLQKLRIFVSAVQFLTSLYLLIFTIGLFVFLSMLVLEHFEYVHELLVCGCTPNTSDIKIVVLAFYMIRNEVMVKKRLSVIFNCIADIMITQ